jgi:hypothetical protein
MYSLSDLGFSTLKPKDRPDIPFQTACLPFQNMLHNSEPHACHSRTCYTLSLSMSDFPEQSVQHDRQPRAFQAVCQTTSHSVCPSRTVCCPVPDLLEPFCCMSDHKLQVRPQTTTCQSHWKLPAACKPFYSMKDLPGSTLQQVRQ